MEQHPSPNWLPPYPLPYPLSARRLQTSRASPSALCLLPSRFWPSHCLVTLLPGNQTCSVQTQPVAAAAAKDGVRNSHGLGRRPCIAGAPAEPGFARSPGPRLGRSVQEASYLSRRRLLQPCRHERRSSKAAP